MTAETPSLAPSDAPTCYASLSPLPEQPICKHYTGATLANLTGDYSCQCLAGVPYERWAPDMDRWPCRCRHLLGLEQHDCASADYSHNAQH
jgi:hypothetical protein